VPRREPLFIGRSSACSPIRHQGALSKAISPPVPSRNIRHFTVSGVNRDECQIASSMIHSVAQRALGPVKPAAEV